MKQQQQLHFEVSLDDGKTWVFMPVAPNNALVASPAQFFNLRYRVSTETDGDITMAIPTKTIADPEDLEAWSDPEGLMAWDDWGKVSVSLDEVRKAANKSILTIRNAQAGKPYEFQLEQEQPFDLIEGRACAVRVSLKTDGNVTEEVMYTMTLQQPKVAPTIALFCSDKLVYLVNETMRIHYKLGYSGRDEDLKDFKVKMRIDKQTVLLPQVVDGSGIAVGESTASSKGKFTCKLEVMSPVGKSVAQASFEVHVTGGSGDVEYLYPFLLKDPGLRKAPPNNDNRGQDWQVMGLFVRPDDPNHLYALLRKDEEGRLYQSVDGSVWKRYSNAGEQLSISGASLESPFCMMQDGYLYQVGGSRYAPLPSSDLIKTPLSVSHDAVVIQKQMRLGEDSFEVCGHALLVHDQQIYIVGGFSDTGTSNAIYHCDPNSGELKLIATMTVDGKPYRICNHQVRVVGQTAYLFGGSASGFDAGFKKMEAALYQFPLSSLATGNVALKIVKHGQQSLHSVTGSGMFATPQGTVFLAGSRSDDDESGYSEQAFNAVELKHNVFGPTETKIKLQGAEYFQLQGVYFKGVVWLSYGSETVTDDEPLQNKIIYLYVG